jgi:hypothetical protein
LKKQKIRVKSLIFRFKSILLVIQQVNKGIMKIIGIGSFSLLLMVFLYSCSSDKGLLPPVPVSPAGTNNCDSVKYTQDIQPIFNTYCTSCHNPGNLSGNLDLTNYSTASIEAADIKNRAFILKDMPQAGSPAPSDAEREKIKCWVEKGALNN